MYAKVAALHLHATRSMAIFAAVIALSAFLYGTFLLIAVERTATRAHNEEAIQDLSGELGSLQAQYLAAAQALGPERAAALGFVTPRASEISFVETARGLSLQDVGR